ncbi:MAG TPA: pyridoxal-phosphate dependent enzyme [Gaiellaceae bacterium]|nr:pyridoxal-phosphate dependent enzyme [Gaiellaceae bacterium]
MSVTLGEGTTPLIAAPRVSARLGVEVWLKLEGANPTGSFKDRGMAVAVSRALERGAPGVVCASTGNTAASAAAYAARAGIEAAIVIPSGAVAGGKLAQARAVGARIVEIDGGFSAAYEASLELASSEGYTVVNSTNDDRIEGQKRAAFEVLEQLGDLPDALLLPYGGGGNTKAYARGFQEARGRLPRLHPAQAERRDDTFASAIRIVEPVHRAEVDEAVERSGGSVVTLGEQELRAAWLRLARDEGVFCEPASAAGIAALEHGVAKPGERVVCVLTGHGLKDPDAVARAAA